MHTQFEKENQRMELSNTLENLKTPPIIDAKTSLLPIELSSQNSFLSKKQCRKPQNNREWTKEEEKLLLKLNETYPHNWRQISRLIKTKTPIQCSYKFEKLSSESKIAKFSRREDIILIELVNKYGKNFEIISKIMNNKYSKESLKRRYFEKLLPGIAKEISETKKIRETVIEDGNVYNNEISIAINNNYVFLPSNCFENVSQPNSSISLSSLLSNASNINQINEKNKILKSTKFTSNEQNFLNQSISMNSKINTSKKLFTIQTSKNYQINESLLAKSNQILRRLYKRLIQIYQILINLDYSNHSFIKSLLIEKKKELCLQVKNYKFKFNIYKILNKMRELEDTIEFAKTKITFYLKINIVGNRPI